MRVRFHDADGYTVGAIDIPHAAGRFTVAAVGEDRADALVRAAALANRIASDPIMRAIMPPQAQAAITAARGLAAAAKVGIPALRSVWGRLRGKGVTRLAAALAKDPALIPGIAAQAVTQPVQDVGWNPFKKKRKKRRAVQRRSAPPPRQREPEPEQPDDEDQDQGEEEGEE